MRHSFTAPDLQHVPEGQPSRLGELAERHVLDHRQDLALEGGEVDELAVLLLPRSQLCAWR
jgi:hypothetical protein